MSRSLEYECWQRRKTGETRCGQRPTDCVGLLSRTIYFASCEPWSIRIELAEVKVLDVLKTKSSDDKDVFIDRCIGSTSNLLWIKEFKFYQTQSNAIIFQETLPAHCIPKVVRMETGEVIYEKVYMSHQPPPKISLKHEGKENWVQNMLSDQKLGNYLEVSNRTNQFQIQVVKERWDPWLKMPREPCKMEEKRPVLRKSMSILCTNKLFLPKERWDPLLKQTKKMCQIVAKHVLVMKAEDSTLEIYHFVKERRDPLLTMTNQVMSKQCWNEMNMDFRIPGLPHSVVKHAQSTSYPE